MAETYRNIAHPFEPVWNTDSLALVLGTFPSVMSRGNAFYYGHPQNRFWPLTAALFAMRIPLTIAEKRSLLLANRVALWDVLASCDITGSADGSIRNPVPNDIAALLAKAPIRGVFCNGQAAAALYRRFAETATGVPAVTLPSTSPANARWKPDALLAAWAPLRECVEKR